MTDFSASEVIGSCNFLVTVVVVRLILAACIPLKVSDFRDFSTDLLFFWVKVVFTFVFLVVMLLPEALV